MFVFAMGMIPETAVAATEGDEPGKWLSCRIRSSLWCISRPPLLADVSAGFTCASAYLGLSQRGSQLVAQIRFRQYRGAAQSVWQAFGAVASGKQERNTTGVQLLGD